MYVCDCSFRPELQCGELHKLIRTVEVVVQADEEEEGRRNNKVDFEFIETPILSFVRWLSCSWMELL